MKNIKEITIKIDGEKWKKANETAYNKVSKKTKINGFREGHAPKDVFFKNYPKEKLYYDAADLCLDEAYDEMIKQASDLQIVAQPDITVKAMDENGVEFLFTLTLKPEVKLGKYKGLKIKKETVKVTKEEIEHEIEHLRGHYSENVVKEGSIENGDIAVIDFEGFKDGVPFEGGKSENYSLTIGSNTFIPGFEEQLIGLKTNDSKDITVTFPEDYHSEDLKGKEVIFKIKVNEVKQIKVPELDKDFFEDLGMEGIDSKEKLEKQLKENITARKDMETDNKYVDQLLDEGIKTLEVELPDVMIDEETNRMIKQYEENLKMQGLSLQQFYQFTNSDEAALKAQMKEEAAKRVKIRLMLEEIIKAEKIIVTEEEVKKEAEVLARKYQMKTDEFLKQFGGNEMLKYDLEMRKAIDVLKGE